MRWPAPLRGIAVEERGATVVEFAIILPTLCILLLAALDLGYRAYAASVLQGALHEAARMATVGGRTPDDIDARVRLRLSNFARYATVTINTSSYLDYAGVRTPERITQDTAPTGQFNAGDCFEDANGNGSYDLDRGRTGLGNADDIVRYQVTMTFARIVPLGQLLGWSNTQTITADTVLRNQPFAGRNLARPIVC